MVLDCVGPESVIIDRSDNGHGEITMPDWQNWTFALRKYTGKLLVLLTYVYLTYIK